MRQTKVSRWGLIFIIAMLFVGNFGFSQLTDLARLEYSFIPMKNSEDDYQRFRALFNYPIKVSEDNYFVLGAEYNKIVLELEDNYPFDSNLLKGIHIVDFTIGYTFKMNDKWRFAAKVTPRLASTLNDKITQDDLFINGGVFFINDRTAEESLKRPYRLILGLTYNSTAGLPFPLPLVSYYRELSESWSFSLGVPKTNFKYTLDDKNMIQAFLTLDGYFANIQKPLTINGEQAESVSMSVLVGGLGYEYCFTKHLVAYAYTGYTVSLKNSVKDNNRDDIISLNEVSTFYLRSGLKFKI